MNLKNGSFLYKIFLILLFLSPVADGISQDKHTNESLKLSIKDGSLSYYLKEEERTFVRPFKIIAASAQNGVVYYAGITTPHGDSLNPVYVIGRLWGDELATVQEIVSTVPLAPHTSPFFRFRSLEGLLYLHIQHIPDVKEEPQVPGTLLRISFNEESIAVRKDVLDFIPVDGKLLLIEKTTSGTMVNYNGVHTPVLLKGALSFTSLVQNRIAVISGTNEFEIIDIKAGINVYSYGKGVKPLVPEETNCIIECLDVVTHSVGARGVPHVYYRIFINGVDRGRTDTGIASITRTLSLALKTDEYSLIKLERYILDEATQTFTRVNNIDQPKPVKVYIPRNRIIRLKLFLQDGKYSWEQETKKVPLQKKKEVFLPE